MQLQSPTFVDAVVSVNKRELGIVQDYIRLWSQYIGELMANPFSMSRHLRADVQEDCIELHVAVDGESYQWFVDEVIWRYGKKVGPYLIIPLSCGTQVSIDDGSDGMHVRHLCMNYWFETRQIEFVQGYVEIVCEEEYDRSYVYDIFLG